MTQQANKAVVDTKRVYLTLLAFRYTTFSYILLNTIFEESKKLQKNKKEFSEKYIWICAMYIYFSKSLIELLVYTKKSQSSA